MRFFQRARRASCRAMTRLRAALPVLATCGALLAGCGEDGDSRSASKAAPKSTAATAKGTGYTVQPPSGYRDVTSTFDGSAYRIDLAVADKGAKGFATNFIVVREEPRGDFDLNDVMEPAPGRRREGQGHLHDHVERLSRRVRAQEATLDRMLESWRWS